MISIMEAYVQLVGLHDKLRKERNRWELEARALDRQNVVVYSHFMAMKIAYGHCANDVEKILAQFWSEEEKP